MNRGVLHILIATLAGVGIVVCGCEKFDDADTQDSTCNISFGISAEVATRVTVSETVNDAGKYDVSFDEGDKIGVHLYYNNFYYYYSQYNTYAESVIFANQLLEVGSDKTVSYSPVKSWTFSTLYGTAPYKYDAIAYYPYTTNYDSAYNIASKWSGDASDIFVYTYNPSNFDNHCDFMIASATYTGTDSSATNFRSEILASESNIDLNFTRQMASMNFCITKADDLENTQIVVTGFTVYFTAYDTFKFDQSKASGEWSYSDEDLLQGSYTVSVGVDDLDSSVATLATTTANSQTNDTAGDTLTDPEDLVGTGVTVSGELIKSHLYFPPETYVSKIVFDITGGTASTYTWHPHIADIVANTHYTLNLELDPERSN